MNKIFKTTIVLVVVLAIIMTPFIYSKATEEKPYIEIIKDMTNYKKDKTIELTISLKNMKNKISYIEAYIDYDKEIFEEVTSKDFSNSLNVYTLSYFSYSNKANKIVVEFDEDTEVTELCKLKLKVLDNIEDISTTKFKVSYGNCYSYNDDKTIEFGDVTETFAENNDEEKLYLSTEKYKIGENNIKDYEDGDKYISRITKETKLKDYINNLKTNGEITVTKEDGTKLTEEEYVGTGMKLTAIKDKEKIELKIAVSGDLNGDGKVTATDLSTMNQTILKTTKLENEYKLAADLDENNNITATDLSTLNKMLLKIL